MVGVGPRQVQHTFYYPTITTTIIYMEPHSQVVYLLDLTPKVFNVKIEVSLFTSNISLYKNDFSRYIEYAKRRMHDCVSP